MPAIAFAVTTSPHAMTTIRSAAIRAAVYALPSYSVPSSAVALGECTICLSSFAPGEQLRALPCMHVFHRDCMDMWLLRGHEAGVVATSASPLAHSPVCPLCKVSPVPVAEAG